MCAIFGWIGLGDRGDLDLMAESMRHRGPDGDGFFHTSEIAMGMTRLAILDRENGNQPMVSESGDVVVVCNGEIYNQKTLKNELSESGYQFQTENDVEVLPAAYLHWGESFLERLNGMFAIALYDHKHEKILLARDRCGQKPLYMARHGGRLIFSSEIRGIWALGVQKKLNEEALGTYLNLRYVSEPETMFDGVEILPAGHYWSSEGNSIQAWWKTPTEKQREHGVEGLQALIHDSVEIAMASDEPIAVHLSAGIDSSVLLAEIKRQGFDVKTITAGFGAGSDEVIEACRFSKELGLEHIEVILAPEDLYSLPRVVSHMELPVGDALIVAFERLSAATKAAGCKVALGGEGIDEVHAGYSFQKVMLMAERMGPLGRTIAQLCLRSLPHQVIKRMSAFPADIGKSGLEKVMRYLSEYDDLTDFQKGIELRTLFSKTELEAMNLAIHDGELDGVGNLFEQHLRYQFQSWMQDWAIPRQERNCMAYGVEYRMPFLDHRLIEYGLNARQSQKIKGLKGKAMWRDMAALFYPEIGESRVKQPFYFPIEQPQYFNVIEELVSDYLLVRDARIHDFIAKPRIETIWRGVQTTREFLPLKKIMSLLILEIWFREHGV